MPSKADEAAAATRAARPLSGIASAQGKIGGAAQKRLAGHFRRRYGLTPDAVTAGELRAARDLARAKFSRSKWTARVP